MLEDKLRKEFRELMESAIMGHEPIETEKKMAYLIEQYRPRIDISRYEMALNIYRHYVFNKPNEKPKEAVEYGQD